MKEKNLEFDLNLIVHSNIFYIEYWRLTLLKVFAKFAKEERGGVLENSRKKYAISDKLHLWMAPYIPSEMAPKKGLMMAISWR